MTVYFFSKRICTILLVGVTDTLCWMEMWVRSFSPLLTLALVGLIGLVVGLALELAAGKAVDHGVLVGVEEDEGH